MDDQAIERVARRAMERGRARWAVRQGLVVVPLGLSAALVGASAWHVAGATVALYALAVGLGWWRSEAGRGVVAGAWVAVVPLLLAVMLAAVRGGLSASQCNQICIWGATICGAIAGLWLGHTAARAGGLRFATAALTASLVSAFAGCIALGLGSVTGLAGGLVFVGIPVYLHASSAPA